MRRRDFISLVGGGAMWPLEARTQPSLTPIIGFLHSGARDAIRDTAFQRGLNELGYVEGRNVRVEYRWADGQYERLAELAADLVRGRVAVLVAAGAVHTALAAKAATSTIPIVFANGSDPVKFGLVSSLNRPRGNITGVSFFTSQLEAKRLALLHELVPGAERVAAILNPANENADDQSKDLNEAAAKLGIELHILNFSKETDLDSIFASMVGMRANAVVVCADPYFFSQRDRLVALAANYAMPAMYEWRQFADAGGLASYGTSFVRAYHQLGVHTGRILNGGRPADLPVIRSVEFELVINLKAAKALGVMIPQTLLATADEVIE
jgi:putative tryptophan/tyrosine transport system substrate-binding protein